MSNKRSSQSKWSLLLPMTGKLAGTDKASQKKRASDAKRNAIKISGKDTRTYGHTTAAGQRRQARRDAKS